MGAAASLGWILALAACGSADDDGGARDAGTDAPVSDAGMADASSLPTPPAPAELPVLTPCPDGWREIDAEGVPACDPWPASGRASCGPFEMHLPGTSGCAPIGATCPAGDFPTDLPATNVLHVRAGAPAGGDGTRAAPFAAVTDAVAAATDGTTIAIAKGTYPESVIVSGTAVHLLGACAAETVITGEPGRIRGAVELLGGSGSSVRDLRLEPSSPSIGALVVVDAVASVAGSIIVPPPVADGVSVSGGMLSIERALVRGGSTDGRAALSATRGMVVARHVVLESDEPGWTALHVARAHVVVEDAAIDHRAVREDDGEWLVEISFGATVEVARAAFSGTAALSALVNGESTAVTIRDSLFVGDGAPGAAASGLFVFDTARFAVSRSRFERASAGAMLAGEPGTDLVLTDTIVRDVFGTLATEAYGRAVDVEMGASATLSRVLLERANEVAFLVSGPGTTGTFEHLTVRDIGPDPAGFAGRALQVQLGAVVTGGPMRSTRQREIALIAASAGTMLSLTDLLVEDTLPRACIETTCAGFGAGIGIGTYAAARVDVARFVIRDGALAGAQVARDGELDLHDGEVSGNPVGANVQVPGYDISRLSDRVLYRDNDRNLDATELPVPDP